MGAALPCWAGQGSWPGRRASTTSRRCASCPTTPPAWSPAARTASECTGKADATCRGLLAPTLQPWLPGRLLHLSLPRSATPCIAVRSCTYVCPPLFLPHACRLKDGQLRGLSVPMGGVPAERRPYSCGTLASPTSTTVGDVFTCLAFEPPMRERPLCPACLLAGTASGGPRRMGLCPVAS